MATKSLFDGTEPAQRPDVRSRQIGVRLTEPEYTTLEKLAWAEGRTIGDWARERLLVHMGAPSGDIPTGHLLTEIIGLQLFLSHVLGPLACGQTITTAQYEELLRQVRANKRRAARDAMAEHAQSWEE